MQGRTRGDIELLTSATSGLSSPLLSSPLYSSGISGISERRVGGGFSLTGLSPLEADRRFEGSNYYSASSQSVRLSQPGRTDMRRGKLNGKLSVAGLD